MSSDAKEVVALAVANSSPYKKNFIDFPEDKLHEYAVLVFLSVREWNTHRDTTLEAAISKSKNFYVSHIEDILDTEDTVTPEQHEGYMYMLGEFEYPNEESFRSMLEFLSGEDKIIVACSAGSARTGSMVKFLEKHGYVLNKDYNTTFYPNSLINGILDNLSF